MSSGSGRGRRTVGGGLSHSRKEFPCRVCGKAFRSDKLLDHYRQAVTFKNDGEPISKFSQEFADLLPYKKTHTSYFIENNYSRQNMPSVKNVTPAESPTDPFMKAKLDAARKKQKLSETTCVMQGKIFGTLLYI